VFLVFFVLLGYFWVFLGIFDFWCFWVFSGYIGCFFDVFGCFGWYWVLLVFLSVFENCQKWPKCSFLGLTYSPNSFV